MTLYVVITIFRPAIKGIIRVESFPLTVQPINVSYLIMLGLLPREK
jgi:hypothetical protein